MGFTSLAFLVFFPMVWLVYLLLPGRLRVVWLLAASYGFLCSFGIKYLAALIGSTLVTIAETGTSSSPKQNRNGRTTGVFTAVVIFHVAALCFFKYNRSNIALPIGMSFYTFQAIGYLTDVYRGTAQAEHNLLNFALFQAFFPKLVQGPIERGGNLLRQIQDMDRLPARDAERIRRSALLLLWGLCEKLLIADRIASSGPSAVWKSFWRRCFMPFRSTAISQATRIWREASPGCWVLICWRTLSDPTWRIRCRISGADGICP